MNFLKLSLLALTLAAPAFAADLEYSPQIKTKAEAIQAAMGFVQGMNTEDDARLKKNIKENPGQSWLRYSAVDVALEGAGFMVSIQREFPTPGCYTACTSRRAVRSRLRRKKISNAENS